MRDALPEWLSTVREKVESLRYGAVQIVVHDSKVTQIERTEKTRIESRSAAKPSRPPANLSSDQPDTLEETISQ